MCLSAKTVLSLFSARVILEGELVLVLVVNLLKNLDLVTNAGHIVLS